MSSYSILADEIVTVLFVSGFFTTDTQRGLHDGFKWTCSSLYIRRCHVSFSGASKLGDAFESKQLPLPRAKAHCVCGLIRLSEKRVGNPSQLPQSLHLTSEYTRIVNEPRAFTPGENKLSVNVMNSCDSRSETLFLQKMFPFTSFLHGIAPPQFVFKCRCSGGRFLWVV